MLLFFIACFSKGQILQPVVEPTVKWDANSNLMGNLSIAMHDCRQKILNNHLYNQGLCKETLNEEKTVKRTICSGTVSVRVIYKVEDNTIWCRKGKSF